jgi:hypothetical protein
LLLPSLLTAVDWELFVLEAVLLLLVSESLVNLKRTMVLVCDLLVIALFFFNISVITLLVQG